MHICRLQKNVGTGIMQIIVVDDNKINNIICSANLKHVYPAVSLNCYENPNEAISFLRTELNVLKSDKLHIFLDLNMPEMDGWEFLETFRPLSLALPDYHLYILSSSIAESDIEEARKHDLVEAFVQKPLTREKIIRLQMKKEEFDVIE